jgi:prepilin-type N-terminal cleavage/methylation domain-containing protein
MRSERSVPMRHADSISRAKPGFTLIEVLGVIAIIALLSAVLLGSVRGVQERARYLKAKAELAHLAQGLEEFRRSYGNYPKTVGTVAETVAGDASVEDLADANFEPGSAVLFRCLTGSFAANVSTGRVFVELSKLTLEYPLGVAAVRNNAFLDPWGHRYVYLCRDSSGAPSSGTAVTWLPFLLFSAGPDGQTTRQYPTGYSRGTQPTRVDVDDVLSGETT